ncbi:peptide synthetase [Renibacterium salmoninarum ATCC 33209]|uniref:Peptide synthetase n=1 Tax=Renibacterium salmoninarum (strain ATCC 33209 / DSM 20767 / JCM 11484 / NBRC 15589 / NCIMB 2235) TaxID=288705 RepID=A9WV30_RENSM|nr:peptide synthetase [Renibacterium salmoninarum ATCC 33209]
MFAAPFMAGRTVIASQQLQLDPVQFGQRIDAEGVTVLQVVPSYLDAMLDAWEHHQAEPSLELLKYLSVTGEACLPKQVNRWLTLRPQVLVVNAYGPT